MSFPANSTSEDVLDLATMNFILRSRREDVSTINRNHNAYTQHRLCTHHALRIPIPPTTITEPYPLAAQYHSHHPQRRHLATHPLQSLAPRTRRLHDHPKRRNARHARLRLRRGNPTRHRRPDSSQIWQEEPASLRDESHGHSRPRIVHDVGYDSAGRDEGRGYRDLGAVLASYGGRWCGDCVC